jgi:hypothetical protein
MILIGQDMIMGFLEETRGKIIARANEKDQNVSGKVANSLEVSRYEDSRKEVYRLIGFKWIIAAWETGRGKGKWPPRGSIEDWIERKGIIAKGITRKSLAFLIARKIGEYGTRLHRGEDSRWMGKRMSGTLTDFVNEANLKELVKEYGHGIIFEINKYLRDGDKN